MPKVHWFFDYHCPFCLRGHEMLLEQLPSYPQIEIVWRPCEAHPRPDSYGLHSDLCARAMLFAQDAGVDILEFHRVMYHAAQVERVNIEDVNVVAKSIGSLVDASAYLKAMQSGAYEEELRENNRLAWEVHGFAAVPSMCADKKKLGSVENIGLSTAGIKAYFDTLTQ